MGVIVERAGRSAQHRRRVWITTHAALTAIATSAYGATLAIIGAHNGAPSNPSTVLFLGTPGVYLCGILHTYRRASQKR